MRHKVLQVCAWRIKYLLSLDEPMDAAAWRALEALWIGSRLDVTILSTGVVLYKLLLPEKKGMLTGSSISADIYAVLLRAEAQDLLARVMETLRRVYSLERSL